MKEKTKLLPVYNRVGDNSLLSALKNGGVIVWLSCLIMGLGNFAAGQIVKGVLFLAIEAAFVYYMYTNGLYWLYMLPSLGDTATSEVWSDELGVYVYVQGDNSQQILLFAVATIAIIIAFVIAWQSSVRSGYMGLMVKKNGEKAPSIKTDLKSLLDENVHKLLMLPPFAMIAIFTMIPLAYMMLMAFTNYSAVGDHLILFDWVGLQNFKALFDSGSAIGKQFGSVLLWTLIWAFFATFLNFFLGTFMAIIINRKTTRCKGLWRTILSLTIAVPQFVSLMIIRNMFKDNGAVNTLFQNLGILAQGQVYPWMTDATWARILLIVINLWVGIPYTVMQVTGILQNIPEDQYEAARIDGASVVQQFIYVTLPYMIFVLTPYIITQFTGNINNFNIIYLLTGGGPTYVGDSAGQTDLLVTWLYKLSIDKQQFNMGAVIGIFTFIVLAVVALVTYRNSGSYKNEEGFK